MTEEVFEALRVAVNTSKQHHVLTVAQLRGRLQSAGYTPEVVKAALEYWAKHSHTKER